MADAERREKARVGGPTREGHEAKSPSLGGVSQRVLDEEKRKGRLSRLWGGKD